MMQDILAQAKGHFELAAALEPNNPIIGIVDNLTQIIEIPKEVNGYNVTKGEKD